MAEAGVGTLRGGILAATPERAFGEGWQAVMIRGPTELNAWRWFSLTTANILEDSNAHSSCVRTHAYRLDTAGNHIYHDAKFVRTNLTFCGEGGRWFVRRSGRLSLLGRVLEGRYLCGSRVPFAARGSREGATSDGRQDEDNRFRCAPLD